MFPMPRLTSGTFAATALLSLLCHKNISFETRRKGNIKKEREKKENSQKQSEAHEWNVFLALKVRVTKVLRTDRENERLMRLLCKLRPPRHRQIWSAITTTLFH